MELVKGFNHWKEAISLFVLCIVWILLEFMEEGLSPPKTPYEERNLVLLLLTVGMLVHEARQTASA